MKHTLKTILFLFLCGTLPAFAQQPKTRLGFKLQPGFTDTYSPYGKQVYQMDIHPRFTFNYGVQAICQVKDSRMFVETGLYFADRGSLQKNFVSGRINSQGAYYSSTSDIYIHNYYVSLPVLFRVEHKHLYASFGPVVDCYTHTKWVWIGGEEEIEKRDRRVGDFLSRFELGANLGIGAQWEITNRLGFYVEADFSTSDFYRDPVNKKFYFYWNYLAGVGLTFNL